MTAFLDIYWTAFKTALAEQFQYRAAMAIWMLFRILEPVIYLVVWSTVAQARGGQVGGYETGDFVAYYIVLMVVNQFTFTWIMFEFEYRVRQGELSPLLLKPIHPIHQDIADNLAYKLLTTVILFPTVALLVFLFQPSFHPQPWAIVAFFPAMALAFLMRFFVEWTLALAAFWTTRVSAINQMYFVLGLFLSGRIAPISLLPEPVQLLANLLPYRWSLAFPVELFLGRLTEREMWTGFAAQAIWLALAFLIMSFTWRRGLRRYSAVGS
ncbi:MAG: ABC-2 family transporter protein [bacterium]|nr:ABC-2 family transporter protein [bacterium]